MALLHLVFPDRLNWLASTYGIVVYLSGLVLAWIFHRSRAFLVLGLVGWLDISVMGGQESSQLYDIISPLVVENVHRPEVSIVLGTTILGLLGILAPCSWPCSSPRPSLMRCTGIAGPSSGD